MRTSFLISAAFMIAGLAARAPAEDGAARTMDRETIVVTARSVPPAAPNIYGTVALGAGVTVYGARWRRVSAADERDPRVIALANGAVAASGSAFGRLAWVQAAVGARIRPSSDLDIYHVSDYWAQAGETLDRGEGDSEDIAILKMQILKAAGIPARDIYLSIGRDQRRGADTRLLVHAGDRFFALDDHGVAPTDAGSAHQFEPVITLGRDGAWLHGYHYAGRGVHVGLYHASLTTAAR